MYIGNVIILHLEAHISIDSPVNTHCIRYALSNPKLPKLSEQCAHEHSLFCEQCENGNSCLDAIEEAIDKAEITQDLKDNYMWLYKKGREAIFSYRSHIIR